MGGELEDRIPEEFATGKVECVRDNGLLCEWASGSVRVGVLPRLQKV